MLQVVSAGSRDALIFLNARAKLRQQAQRPNGRAVLGQVARSRLYPISICVHLRQHRRDRSGVMGSRAGRGEFRIVMRQTFQVAQCQVAHTGRSRIKQPGECVGLGFIQGSHNMTSLQSFGYASIIHLLDH
jgi:hypothetical protein